MRRDKNFIRGHETGALGATFVSRPQLFGIIQVNEIRALPVGERGWLAEQYRDGGPAGVLLLATAGWFQVMRRK